jgi:hypothetical protein
VEGLVSARERAVVEARRVLDRAIDVAWSLTETVAHDSGVWRSYVATCRAIGGFVADHAPPGPVVDELRAALERSRIAYNEALKAEYPAGS